MGKKTRKTRWRTLPIADESDSEESNVLSSTQLAKSYHHRPYYAKFTYSSQSTPTRRFPYESKSTRSSSTASETKITFNEDEYTKITTPRQDVLFKKGYLSKPKNYQTQTSTGNSTASTGNSTGNGTPDHQSADGTEGTDLEYESQFVFPQHAAFVDHNGIYYINGYEHYPLVMYNHPPICYPDFPVSKTKRNSTGSLSESTSPHTEETSQDLSQSGAENASNPPETNHVFNVVYPSYYFNTTACSNNVTTTGQVASTEPRKIKKKRRRKLSKTVPAQEDGTSTVSSSEEEGYSSDEEVTQVEVRVPVEDDQSKTRTEEENCQTKLEDGVDSIAPISDCPNQQKDSTNPDEDSTENTIGANMEESTHSNLEERQSPAPEIVEETQNQSSKFNLNAEEFIPRAYRPIPMDPNLHFVNVHPNFVPLPLLNHPLTEINPSNFNPQFLPPGIPLNFVTADPKLLPNFVSFGPNQFIPSNKVYEQNQPPHNTPEHLKKEDAKSEDSKNDEAKENQPGQSDQDDCGEKDAPAEDQRQMEKSRKELSSTVYKTEVDIAKIVSKLEEAAKEQKYFEDRRQNYRSPSKFNKSPKMQRFNNQNYDKRRPRRLQEAPRQVEEVIQTIPQKVEIVQTKSEEIQTDPPQTKTETPESTDLERKPQSSPKHQSYRGSPKKYNPRNFKGSRSTEMQNFQLSRSVPSNAEYSESLKRPPTNYINSKSCPRFERYSSNNSRTNSANTNATNNRINNTKKGEDITKEGPKVPEGIKSSQWISVSSKKKRKNRLGNEEEVDALPDAKESIPDVCTEMSFEADIIEDKIVEQSSSIVVEEFIEMVSTKEVLQETDVMEIEMQDLKDIEQELLKDAAVVSEIIEEIPQITAIKAQIELVQPAKMHQKDTQKKKNKKSSNKCSIKKRIIILDPDLTSKNDAQKNNNTNNSKPPSTSTSDEVTTKEIQPNVETRIISESIDESKSDDTKNLDEQTAEKKKSKKKKKSSKTNLMSASITSISSSSTTLNNADDSYDFLLDTSALIDDKTNVEISEELDKMIQKGLFGNLEEKFKSLNVSVDDDFFRSLSLKPKTQSTPEKGFIKATNFTTILNGANQNLPKMKATVEEDDVKVDVDFSKIKLPECEPQPSTSRSTGHFLDEVIESETGPPLELTEEDVTLSKSNDGRLRNKSKKGVIEIEEEKVVLKDEDASSGVEVKVQDEDLTEEEVPAVIEGETLTDETPSPGEDLDNNLLKNDDQLTINIEPVSPESTTQNISITMSELNQDFQESHPVDDATSKDSIELKPLYPITAAVKEWMSKTRETTPDIELLKSPDTIYKEFLIEDSTEDESDTETRQKNGEGNPSAAGYLKKRECCGGRVAAKDEDQITISETWSMSEDAGLQEEDLLDCWESEPIEQGQDALESYDSTYGHDEDFIKQQKRNGTLPKHGSLPYRAICCNLM